MLVWVLGLLSAFIYYQIMGQSFDCEQSDPTATRPLLRVLYLFTIAGVIYLVGCWRFIWIRRDEQPIARNKTSAAFISMIAFAILFRIILLFSVPIQEVDLYRYIWDGVVTAEGISPYRYSPQEVEDMLAATENGQPDQPTRYRRMKSQREELKRLGQRASTSGLADVLELIHFEQYTTPYPPTNQPFFAAAAISGRTIGPVLGAVADPQSPDFWGYLYSMKGVLILFDLGTGLMLILLLRLLKLPAMWSIAWLWCPLVLKEIANSGHLDSIAVFFTTAAVFLLVKSVWGFAGTSANSQTFLRATAYGGAALVLLALGVGAKVYPFVLFPIFFTVLVKRFRLTGVALSLGFLALVGALLWPMLSHTQMVRSLSPPPATQLETFHPPAGIEAFAKYWEMNDFLFMMLVENLKPYGESAEDHDPAVQPGESRIWFVGTSNDFRHSFAERVSQMTGPVKSAEAPDARGIPKSEVAFWLTRRVTLAIFALVVAWSCYCALYSDDPRRILELTFLTIAWFWLLAPTQNPWYWTWALPTICFCRNRLWYGVALIAMAYYLRFYCEYHLLESNRQAFEDQYWQTPYWGTAMFDFIVPILEFGPFLILLFATWAMRKINKNRQPSAEEELSVTP